MATKITALTNTIMGVFKDFIDTYIGDIQSIATYDVEKEEFLSDCLRGMVFNFLCSVDFEQLNSSEKYVECAATIADMLEEVFAERDLLIPSEERNNEPCESCIYGSVYYELEDAIKEALHGYMTEITH